MNNKITSGNRRERLPTAGYGGRKHIFLTGLMEVMQAEKNKVTMGLDLQPDGLTAGLAGHCKPDKKIHSLREKKG